MYKLIKRLISIVVLGVVPVLVLTSAYAEDNLVLTTFGKNLADGHVDEEGFIYALKTQIVRMDGGALATGGFIEVLLNFNSQKLIQKYVLNDDQNSSLTIEGGFNSDLFSLVPLADENTVGMAFSPDGLNAYIASNPLSRDQRYGLAICLGNHKRGENGTWTGTGIFEQYSRSLLRAVLLEKHAKSFESAAVYNTLSGPNYMRTIVADYGSVFTFY